jgi:hypothetical protein
MWKWIAKLFSSLFAKSSKPAPVTPTPDAGSGAGGATNSVPSGGTGEVTPTPDTSGEPTGVVNLCPVDALQWPITSTLTASFSGGNVTLAYDKAGAWKADGGVVANPHILVPKAGGGFYDVTWEWLKPGQTVKQMKGKSWSGHIKRTETNGWEPVVGQGYWLYVSTLCRDSRRNGNERTNYSYATYR